MIAVKKPQLLVKRHLETVTLTITSESQYAAMELYDSVCASAAEGRVVLELDGTVPNATRP